MRKAYVIGAVALLFSACRPNITIDKNASAGLVDFSNYLAVGNSLTAGYMDGSLTVSGQLNSYPQRLFEQFNLISKKGAVGPFIQPLVTTDDGYPWAKYVLGMTYNACIPADSSLGPVLYASYTPHADDDQYVATQNNGQVNNIGVPGIRAVDYRVPGYATFAKLGGAPFAARFYHSNAATYSPNDELQFRVNNLHPTFFTMWLGSNDVLAYALKGGRGNDASTARPLFGNFYEPNDISPISAFDSSYDLAVTTAISTGASGALINIPDITSIPYFTTIPINGLTIPRQGLADTLVAIYRSKGIKVEFHEGDGNLFIIKDHAGLVRQATPGELILLSTSMDSIKCKGWGTTVAIPDTLVLTTDEIQFIRTATTAYNAFIKERAQLHNLAYVDMNAYFSTLPSGMVYNGINYNTQFVTGGAFSLDGIHPTARGYALVANEIIRTINTFYKANVTPVDVNKYKGVTFP